MTRLLASAPLARYSQEDDRAAVLQLM